MAKQLWWTLFVVVVIVAEVCDAYTLVAVSDGPSRRKRDLTVQKKQTPAGKPDMKSLKVDSVIKYRFANTIISSRLMNRANYSQQVYFSTILPETAFISGFAIIMNGTVYKAYVKEKEEARREYDRAVSLGVTAGHVELSARESNTFTVSVNVEAHGKVTFNLTYEELLQRDLGLYRHKISLNPGQLVKDLKVTVRIEESSNITLLEVPNLQESNDLSLVETYQENTLAHITYPAGNSAVIKWTPSLSQQQELNADGVKGLLEVRYNVAHSNEILVNDGYFVHFFAPTGIPPMCKHVVFVLDRSGSMFGQKILQLKEAMGTILDELRQGDSFSLVTFSSDLTVWIPGQGMMDAANTRGEPINRKVIVSVTPEKIQQAKEIVNEMNAEGGTHIYDALHTSLNVIQLGISVQTQNSTCEPMLFFLTDGEPNGPNSDLNTIIRDTTENNKNPSAVLYSLAFGSGADFKFLKKLSLKNRGFARKIYEAADASLQLRNFFRKVSSPLLANVTFNYTDNQVDTSSLTRTSFYTHLNGTEITVAGRLKEAITNVDCGVGGQGLNGEVTSWCLPSVIVVDYYPRPQMIRNASSAGFMERLWAYLTIQQLLELKEQEANETVKERAKELALKYSFVTPLTSLVVVKPNETDANTNPEEAKANPNEGGRSRSVSLSRPLPIARSYGGTFDNLGDQSVAVRGSVIRTPVRTSARHAKAQWGSNNQHISVQSIGSTVQSLDEDETIISCRNDTNPGLPYVPLTNYTWFPLFSNESHVTLLIDGAQETFQLGYTEPNIEHDLCHSRISSPSHCRHLPHCARQEFAANINVYLDNFCRIGSFAGVCCPDYVTQC